MAFSLMNLAYFLGACGLLVVSAELLVNSLLRIAQYYRLREFVVGFIVVAFAAIIPEFFIGVNSALNQNPALALGNVIGANIIDLTLIIGIITILRGGIRVETKAVRSDTLYMFGMVMLPLLLMLVYQKIDRFGGFVLLLGFVFYVSRLLSQEKRFTKRLESIPKKNLIVHIVIAAIGFVFIYFFSILVVRTASVLASDLNAPPILIGLFFIAFGTTLPEFTFETKAILTRHKYTALGDLIGNVVARSTLVLGVTAIIYPIQADYLLFLTSAFFMLIVAFLFTTFVDVEKHILVQEGIALIILYILFIIVELNIRVLEIG
ncbi:MAG: sodium:calcium antiporter [Candidatus Altiarchaeota archaeon]|nr:sodium:calcium antiporter [Candidatus Altiarchaeota archaeon]